MKRFTRQYKINKFTLKLRRYTEKGKTINGIWEFTIIPKPHPNRNILSQTFFYSDKDIKKLYILFKECKNYIDDITKGEKWKTIKK